jgi:aryl-alcohol dehydrogenase-like predicted oxidoreductase
LLHRPQELGLAHGRKLFDALKTLKARGFVRKIGVSIYEPQELASIVATYPLDLVQAPLNLLDRRLVQSGWLDRLATAGIEVHARSVFLQGLLLMSSRPAYFRNWANVWERWDDWFASRGCTPLAACMQFVLSLRQVARVVVGVDSVTQLHAILAAVTFPRGDWPEEIWSDDPALLNPGRWPQNQS